MLAVKVVSEKIAIAGSLSKVKLPKDGVSPPILIDLSSIRSMDSIIVQPIAKSSFEVVKGTAMTFDEFTVKQVF